MARQKRKKRKPTKAERKINFKEILISAIVDLLVGLILLLVDKLTD